jgi:hypothetical protein
VAHDETFASRKLNRGHYDPDVSTVGTWTATAHPKKLALL